MNRIFYSSAETFLFRLSDDAERYKGDCGNFKVSYRKGHKLFASLLEAFLFYIALEEEADLWDISQGETLIERKIMFFLN